MRSKQPKRNWWDALRKIQEEEGLCRVCGKYGVEAAHITGRIHDEPMKPGMKTLYVKPDSIVPLCRAHHMAFDSHALDLISYLNTEEQVQAVKDLGSITLALKRLAPSAYKQLSEVRDVA